MAESIATVAALKACFKLDANAVVPSYALVVPENSDQWLLHKKALVGLLRRLGGSEEAEALPEELRLRYVLSDLHREHHAGCLADGVQVENVLWFKRLIENIKEDDPLVGSFLDSVDGGLDPESVEQLNHLANFELPTTVPADNIVEFEVEWAPGKGIDPEAHKTYLDNFSRALTAKLRQGIDAVAGLDDPLSDEPLLADIVSHLELCQSSQAQCVGRQKEIGRVVGYAQSAVGGGERPPLIVVGGAGSGKRTIVSRAFVDLQGWAAETSALMVVRFVGHSISSNSVRRLLSSVCQQICRVYGDSEDEDGKAGYSDLISKFHRCLAMATADKPLLLVIDSLGRVEGGLGADGIYWLPLLLPPHCRVVLTVAFENGDPCYEALASRFRDDAFYVKVPELKVEQGVAILSSKLDAAGRRLTARQLAAFKDVFSHTRFPITSEVAFEHLRGQRSFDPPALSGTVEELVQLRFAQVEAALGAVPVAHALAYLCASRDGLSESELEDILSCDNAVLHAVYPDWVPPVLRVTPMFLARMRHALGPWLHESIEDGLPLLRWSHPVIASVAHARYLADDIRAACHGEIADYFLGKWARGRKKKFVYSEAQRRTMQLGDATEFGADRSIADQPLLFEPSDGSMGFRRQQSGLAVTNAVLFNRRKLRELPYQLKRAGRIDTVMTECCFNIEWLVVKLLAMSLTDVLQELEDPIIPDRRSLARTKEALIDSFAFVCDRDPLQLPAQLAGRLYPCDGDPGFPGVQTLLADIRTSWHESVTRARLGKVPTVLPRPGWLCLPVVGNPKVLSMTGHTSAVMSVAVSTDNLMAVSGTVDGFVKVWTLLRGDGVETIKAHSCAVTAVALVTNKYIVSGGADGSVKLWRLDSAKLVEELTGHKVEISSIFADWSNSHLFAAAQDGTVCVWKLGLPKSRPKISSRSSSSSIQSGLTTSSSSQKSQKSNKSQKPQKSTHATLRRRPCVVQPKPVSAFKSEGGSAVLSCSLGSNSQTLVLGLFNGHLEFWDVWDRSAPKMLKSLKAHDKPVYAVQITPTNDEVVSGSEDGEVKKFSLETHEQTFECRSAEEWVIHLAFAPDASFSLASTPDGTLFRVNLQDGDLLGQLFSDGFVESLAISPDSSIALTAVKDENTLQKWNMEESAEPPAWKGHASTVGTVALSDNGKLGATVSQDSPNKAISWDMDAGRMLRSFAKHQGPVLDAAFFPDNKSLVTVAADGSVWRWDPVLGKELEPSFGSVAGKATRVVVAADVVAVGCDTGVVTVFSASSGEILHTFTVKGGVSFLAASRSNELIAAASPTTAVVFAISDRHCEAGTELSTIDLGQQATSLGFLGDSSLVVGYRHGAIKKWSAKLGQEEASASVSKTDAVVGVLPVFDGFVLVAVTAGGSFVICGSQSLSALTALDVADVMTRGVKSAAVSQMCGDGTVVFAFGCNSGCVGTATIAAPPDAASDGDAGEDPNLDTMVDLATSFFFASEVAVKILRGDLSHGHTVVRRMLRAFVSSSGTDTEAERSRLLSDVSIAVRAYARSRGFEARLVCDSWTAPGQTVKLAEQEVYLNEIKLCQQLSGSFNFISLLGQKYGTRTVPKQIAKTDYDMLLAVAATARGDKAQKKCVIS